MPLNIAPRNIEIAINRVKEDGDIHPDNKRLILEFQRYLELNDFSRHRQFKYLSRLPILARQMKNKAFDRATREDIESLVLWINRRRKINDTANK